MMSHLKTILVVAFGFFMFTPRSVTLNLLGVVVALIGNIGYSEVKRRTVTKSAAPSLVSRGSIPVEVAVTKLKAPKQVMQVTSSNAAMSRPLPPAAAANPAETPSS